VDAEEAAATGESLQRAIMDLTRIVNPADNPRCWGAATHPSMVHIVGTGVTPTLMDLPLSALQVLSRLVLYKDMQWIVLDCCNIVCVGKHGDAKESWRQSNIDQLLLQKVSKPPGGGCIV
jgi:hypothetical protein